MNPKLITTEDLRTLLIEDTPSIDVRAPVEFLQGYLPGAVNLPILNDVERAEIGLTYKKEGNAAAVALGYQLISGTVKEERVYAWISFLEKNPTAFIYCFRGGQRSKIAQTWTREAGIDRPRLDGGFKKARNFCLAEIESFSQKNELLVLSGPTGSGKTQFITDVRNSVPVLELEFVARHRGSAFGAMKEPQPSQINFENELAVAMLKLEKKIKGRKVLVEDESRLIGHRALPETLFAKMRTSPVIWLEESFEQRVANIFSEYVLEPASGLKGSEMDAVFEKHKNSVRAITRKLGGLRAQEILDLLEKSKHEFLQSRTLATCQNWIGLLLSYYYDPLYHASLERRQIEILFKGNREACRNFLQKFS